MFCDLEKRESKEIAPGRLTITHPYGQYEVIVGAGLLPAFGALVGAPGAVAVITDAHVGPLYAAKLAPVDCLVTIPTGEQHKTLATVQAIYEQLLAAGLDRQGTVAALGGGVVGDVAGFVAATYMRGVHFVACPTTLLAMVDASVGGKTGVDLPQGKNLVGAFKQPVAVLADVDTLATLPPAEFAAGMAEVVKHGLIADPGLLDELEAGTWSVQGDPHSPEALQSLILRAIRVKRNIVQADPFEQGRRATLNLGHTFAHAIEQVSGYIIRHGQAVAMGLVAAVNLSIRLGHCHPAWQPRVEKLLAQANLPARIPGHLPTGQIVAAMGSDKKKAAGRLRFVLLRQAGDVFVTGDVPETAVVAAIEAVKDENI